MILVNALYFFNFPMNLPVCHHYMGLALVRGQSVLPAHTCILTPLLRLSALRFGPHGRKMAPDDTSCQLKLE